MPLYEQDALKVYQAFKTLPEEAKPLASDWMKRYADQQDELGLPLFPTHEAEKRTGLERYRSMFADIRKVDELAPTITTMMAWSNNPDADRARVANAHFLARRYGKTPLELHASYDLYKQDWLVRQRVKSDMDDLGLYSLAKGEVEKEVQAEQLVTDARQAAMSAALSGKPALQALNEWQGVNAGPQPRERLEVSPEFVRTYNAAAKVLRPYRDVLSQASAAMDRFMDGRAQEGDEQVMQRAFNALMEAPGKDRRMMLGAFRLKVQEKGTSNAETKGGAFGGNFWQQIGESMFRMGKGMAFSSAEETTALESVPVNGEIRFHGDAIKTAEDANRYVREHVTQFLSNKSVEAAGPGMPAMPAMDTRNVIKADAEATRLIEQAKDRAERSQRIQREWNSLENAIDPVSSTTANLFGSTGAALFLTAATRSGSLPVLAKGYANLRYDSLRQEYPMMQHRDALLLSGLSGAAEAAFDKLGVKAFDRLPGLKSVLYNGLSKEMSKAAVKRFVGTNTAEAGIEVAQDLSSPVFQTILSALKNDVPGYDWDREQSLMSRYKEYWLTMLPLTLVFGGVSSFKEYAGTQELLNLNTRLGALGVIEADRLAVADAVSAGDYQKADALMKEANARRDPAVAAEFGDKLAAQDIEASQAFEAAQRLGLMPHIRRDNEGFLVRDADGNVARFSDWEQTREAVQGHFNEIEMQEIDAVARMADRFISTTPDSLDGGEEFNLSPGRRASLESQLQEGRITPEQYAESAVVAGMLEGMTREESMKTTWDVLGSNAVEQKEGVRRSVSDIMRGANVLTVAEEGIEGRWKAALEVGRYTREQGIGWVRLAESAMGETLLPAEGEISPRQLTEAISKIVVADVFGRRKDGSRVPAGIVSQGVMAAASNNAEATGLRAFLRAFRAFFAQVMGRARALRRARAEGKLTGEWETMLDDLLGIDSQQRFEREAEAEAQAMADEWVDEGDFSGYQNQTTGDASFSLRRVDPKEVERAIQHISQERGIADPREAWDYLNDDDYIKLALSMGFEPKDKLYKLTLSKDAMAGLVRLWQAVTASGEAFQYGRSQSEDIEDIAEAVSTPRKPVYVDRYPDQIRLTGANGFIDIIHASSWHPYISSTDADSSGEAGGGGSQLYQAALDWMHNSGKQIKDDPRGLSEINAVRRTSNFLASALRWGTTEHLKPHSDQDVPWMSGTSAKSNFHNIAALAVVEMENAFKAVEAAKNWRYDFANERFFDSSGNEVTRADFLQAVVLGDPETSGIGISTLRRAVLTASGLEAAERGELEGLVSDTSGRVKRGLEKITYSLRALRPGEAIDRALSSRLNAPEKRITFFSRAREAVARVSLDSLTWRGDVIEGTDTLEQRDAAVASLERERSFRQRARQRELRDEAMSNLQPGLLAVYERELSTLEDHPLVTVMLNDHGKLMSRSRAEKLGKLDTDGKGNAGDYDGAPWLPPQWYSAQGGIMPDVMAQNLYDAGLLNQATPDALWDALGRVMSGTRSMNQSIRDARAAVREIGLEAYKKSMDEANQWFNKAVKDLPTNHEKMLAAFKTMDAILFAFPPEVRGRVGGSTKLASLKSDKARLKHMLDRIAKLDAELEKFLQEEIRSDLEKIFDKAKPTGGKGEKAVGKIGVEGHRIFKAIGGMVDLSADEVTKRIEGINADIEQESDLAKVGNLLEEQQFLELFGGLNAKRGDKSWLKSAAELKAAWDFAADVYATGRNKWKAQLEAQLAEVKDLQAQHIAAMGGKGTDARLSEVRAKAGKLDGLGLGTLALVQVLERAYGTTHPLVRRWYGAARKATAQKGDAILGVRREFADVLKNAMPESSSIERETAVFDLKTQRTVIAPKVEGVSVKDLEIPLEMAVKLVTGEAELKPFGLEEHHRDEIQAALDEHQAEESQRESVTVQVVESKGMQADVPLTPMQAVHITMLWAQEMYRPGMERHGWTPETLEAIEEQLPPLAVQIRAFLASKYDSGYDSMNQVYQRMYGIDLPRVANYAPGTFMHEGMEIDSDPFGQGLIQNGGVRASFVKQRKQHMARPKWDSDALDLFFSHTSNVEHWKAFAELGREMRRVLLSAESKAATEAHGGKALESIMGKWVEIIERGGLETARDSSAWDKLARRIGSNRSVIALAYNLGTLMKQSTALFGAMIRMPVAAYGRGFMRLFAGRLPVRDIFRQDFIQRRIQSGYSPEARAAMAQLWDAPPSRRRHLLQQGMELIGFVDGIFTTGTAAIAYDYHYRQGIQAGLTPEQARGEALTAAEDVVSRVAQPSETIDKSVFEIGAGAWGRLGFMFASDARQKWALLQEAVVNRKQDPATLRRVLAFHLMSGIAIQTISSAWRDARDSDDDEMFDPKNWNPVSFLGGVILGPISGVPLLSGALDTFSGRGELVEAALSVKDIATGKGDMKDVVTTLSGLAYLGTAGKYEDAATFLAVSAKVVKDILGVSENVLE